jgi:hypothetical protein
MTTTSPCAHFWRQTFTPRSGQIADGEVIVAELVKPIDARKAKADDKVEGRLTMDLLSHGQIAIPRGTKIVGHVIDARARTKQVPESIVKIEIDHLVLKNRHEIPLKATIQAVGAALQIFSPNINDLDLPSQSQVQPAPGPNEAKRILTTSYPGSRSPANAAGAVEQPDVGPHSGGPSLGPFSHGVIGIKGIGLSNTAQVTVISSSSENVRLDGVPLVVGS